MAERWPVFFFASDLPEVEGLSFGILMDVKMRREAVIRRTLAMGGLK